MRREHQDFRLAHHVLQPIPGAFHEVRIPRQEPLIHQQHLRADRGGDGETEPDDHPRAVDAHGQVDELVHLPEHPHILLQPRDRRWIEPAIEAAQQNILPPGQAEIEAEMRIEQRVQRPAHPDRTGERLVDPRHRAQQRGLAGAIAADQPEPVARPEGEGDIAQRLHHNAMAIILAHAFLHGVEQRFLQAASTGVVEREVETDTPDLDARHRRVQIRPIHCGALYSQNAMRPRTRAKNSQVPPHRSNELMPAEA